MSDETKYLISKYPFLRINDSEGCWLDCMPAGWAKAFGKHMCDDLMNVLGDYANEWDITDVKEKYGELRIYDAGCPSEIYDEVHKIIDQYSRISKLTCVQCGSFDARTHDGGWILPFCDECFARLINGGE